ncbi:hypothetical protein B0T16DRAFT_421319 [Cercophora newfieldiana]|uniref:Uncharacterized protein n=1 Tax=Cercophora newfieldiana TaxID=92897 RepID=A0AA39XSD9_9PEZI|nr:hypothetical protein B0T16DRAFT_421319 [Cercophora newfieldiana]
MASCVGNPTFDHASRNPNHFDQWPAGVPGYICKTPPFGSGSAPRFTQCCAGSRVFNITSSTSPSDAEYPVSCALFCQIDPRRDDPGRSEFMDCLTDGGKEPRDWEVLCAMMNSNAGVSGVPTPATTTGAGTRTTATKSATGNATGGATPITSVPSATTSGAGGVATTPASGQARGCKARGWVVALFLVVAVLG